MRLVRMRGGAARIAVTALALGLAACSFGDGDRPPASDADGAADAAADDGASLPPPPTWLWRFNPTGHDVSRGYATALAEADDGGVMLAGFDMLSSTVGTVWIARLNPSGVVAWNERLDDGRWIGGMAPHPSGGFLVVGTTEVGSASGTAWLALVGSDGRVAWEKKLDVAAYAGAAAVVPDGADFLVSGYLSAGTDATDNAWVARLDTDGRPIWQKRIPGTCGTCGSSVASSRDGGALVVASLDRSSGRLWLGKLDGDGALVWQRRVDAGLSSTTTPAVHGTADGDVIVTAPSGGTLVLRFDAAGTLEQGLNVSASGFTAYAVDGPDGGLIVAAGDYGTADARYNLWLFGLSVDGLLLWQKSTPSEDLENAHGIVRTRDGAVLAVSGGCCASRVVKLRLDGSFDGDCTAFAPTTAMASRTNPTTTDPGFVPEDFDFAETDLVPQVQDASADMQLICP